jgi:hypothetical protein
MWSIAWHQFRNEPVAMDELTLLQLERSLRTCISHVQARMEQPGAPPPGRRLQQVLALLWAASDELDGVERRRAPSAQP